MLYGIKKWVITGSGNDLSPDWLSWTYHLQNVLTNEQETSVENIIWSHVSKCYLQTQEPLENVFFNLLCYYYIVVSF